MKNYNRGTFNVDAFEETLEYLVIVLRDYITVLLNLQLMLFYVHPLLFMKAKHILFLKSYTQKSYLINMLM